MISLLVVLFNKKIDESETINTLKCYLQRFDSITIYNNGPEIIILDEELYRLNVTLINDISNSSLSYIYNKFISENISDRYVILDDDTTICESYINCLLFDIEDYDIGIPLVRSVHDNKFYYPVVSEINDIFNTKYIFSKYTYSIGSGLVLTSNLVSKLKDKYNSVFDEKFAFYGVDISFFFRLSELSDDCSLKCSSLGIIDHNLSKFTNSKSEFRMKELLIDQILQYKIYHKSKKRILKYLILNYKYIFKFKFSTWVEIFSVMISGRHNKSFRD